MVLVEWEFDRCFIFHDYYSLDLYYKVLLLAILRWFNLTFELTSSVDKVGNALSDLGVTGSDRSDPTAPVNPRTCPCLLPDFS